MSDSSTCSYKVVSVVSQGGKVVLKDNEQHYKVKKVIRYKDCTEYVIVGKKRSYLIYPDKLVVLIRKHPKKIKKALVGMKPSERNTFKKQLISTVVTYYP